MTLSLGHALTMVQAGCFFAFVTDCGEILASCFLFIIASALLWKESSLFDWVLVLCSRRIPQYVNVGKIMHSYMAFAAFTSSCSRSLASRFSQRHIFVALIKICTHIQGAVYLNS